MRPLQPILNTLLLQTLHLHRLILVSEAPQLNAIPNLPHLPGSKAPLGVDSGCPAAVRCGFVGGACFGSTCCSFWSTCCSFKHSSYSIHYSYTPTPPSFGAQPNALLIYSPIVDAEKCTAEWEQRAAIPKHPKEEQDARAHGHKVAASIDYDGMFGLEPLDLTLNAYNWAKGMVFTWKIAWQSKALARRIGWVTRSCVRWVQP